MTEHNSSSSNRSPVRLWEFNDSYQWSANVQQQYDNRSPTIRRAVCDFWQELKSNKHPHHCSQASTAILWATRFRRLKNLSLFQSGPVSAHSVRPGSTGKRPQDGAQKRQRSAPKSERWDVLRSPEPHKQRVASWHTWDCWGVGWAELIESYSVMSWIWR